MLTNETYQAPQRVGIIMLTKVYMKDGLMLSPQLANLLVDGILPREPMLLHYLFEIKK